MPCSDTTMRETPVCCHYLLFTDRKWWQMTEEVASHGESILPGDARTLGGKMEVKRSFCSQGIPQGYLSVTVRGSRGSYLSGWALHKMEFLLSKDTSHLEHFWTFRNVSIQDIWKKQMWNYVWNRSYKGVLLILEGNWIESPLCVGYAHIRVSSAPVKQPSIVPLQSCVMPVHLPWGIPWHPLLASNETPYLLPLLLGMHTNRETGEGRQTEPWRSVEPSLL